MRSASSAGVTTGGRGLRSAGAVWRTPRVRIGACCAPLTFGSSGRSHDRRRRAPTAVMTSADGARDTLNPSRLSTAGWKRQTTLGSAPRSVRLDPLLPLMLPGSSPGPSRPLSAGLGEFRRGHHLSPLTFPRDRPLPLAPLHRVQSPSGDALGAAASRCCRLHSPAGLVCLRLLCGACAACSAASIVRSRGWTRPPDSPWRRICRRTHPRHQSRCRRSGSGKPPLINSISGLSVGGCGRLRLD